jgi:acyl-CoA reductase-like NAD-dependent aldehyde dehydrogenase
MVTIPCDGQLLSTYPHANWPNVKEAFNTVAEPFRSLRKTCVPVRSPLLSPAEFIVQELGTAIATQIAQELGKLVRQSHDEVVVSAKEMFESTSDGVRPVYGPIIPPRDAGIIRTLV